MEQIIPPKANKASNESGKKQDGGLSAIAWHPAFIQALQLELDAYGDSLEFHPEYQLTAEPLRIDCLIIKKKKETTIKKNIAAIFREANLVEYKSPDAYVSVADFYKVYGYACLYASLERVPVTSLTISFVESRYPRDLLTHLREIRNYNVEEKSPGIYTVSGDILPIQVIDSRQLSAGENLWLKNLNRLDAQAALRIMVEVSLQGKAARIGAYLDAITRANKAVLQEVFNMSDVKYELPALREIFDELDWTAEIKAEAEARGKALGEARGEALGEARGEARGVLMGEIRGEERKAIGIAKNLVNLGLPLETVVSVTGLGIEKVKEICRFE